MLPRALAPMLVLTTLLAAHAAQAANNYPVVLVHGFLGFGPDKFKDSGFKYWGGFNDIAAHMQSFGGPHQVMAAGVGPVSSNWDRAAELYYQIKGGCVDYGGRHSARFAQFGALQKPAAKCWAADQANNPHHYPLALYPAWDASHPIHLVGHSQGGPTIRALVQLLENGSPNGDEGGGELYTGGKVGWVRSVTSIASPHNGTTLRDAVLDFVPRLSSWAGQIARLAGGESAETSDLGLEHFGAADRFWQLENHDSAQWELGPDGAREFNAWAKTSPNVYYYSIGASATEAGTACCWFGDPTDRLVAGKQNPAYQYARTDMTFFLKRTAGEWVVPPLQHGMGGYTQAAPGRVAVDASWFQNDGVVNTVSMKAPAGHPVREYDGHSVRGSWNYIKTYRHYDHFDIIGWPNLGPSAYPVYDGISTIIFGL
jgi:triacylglycerol lipase